MRWNGYENIFDAWFRARKLINLVAFEWVRKRLEFMRKVGYENFLAFCV